jgi:hypothetical protein
LLGHLKASILIYTIYIRTKVETSWRITYDENSKGSLIDNQQPNQNMKYIADDYNKGLSIKKLMDKYNMGNTKINNILTRYNVVKRPSTNSKKYKFNEDYFSIIDSEDKAYWLGFLYADGYVNKSDKRFRLELGRKDLDHLKLFEEHISAKHSNVRFRKDRNTYYLTFGNVKFCNKLLELNFKDLHSIWDVVSDDLKHHLIRGVWDGDGTIYHRGKTSVYAELIMLDSHSNLLLEWFSGVNLKHRFIKSKGMCRIGTTSITETLKVCKLIYKDSNVKLNRKYIKYKERFRDYNSSAVALSCR